MKEKQYRAIARSTLVGLMCFAGQAFAYPLLDLDLASSTLLGASKAARLPVGELGENSGAAGGVSSGGAARAGAAGGQGQGQGLAQRASGLGSSLNNPGLGGQGGGARETGSGLCDTALVRTATAAGVGHDIIADLCGENNTPPGTGVGDPGVPGDVVVGPTLPVVDPNTPPDFTSPGAVSPVLVPVVLAVPEPSALLLLGAGLVGLGLRRRKSV